MTAASLFDGRGRWTRYDARPTPGDYLRLDAHAVGLTPGVFTWRWSWSNYLSGEQAATIRLIVRPDASVLFDYRKAGEPMQQATTLRKTPTHNGGHRLDWLCPQCGRAVRYLYGAPFLCRHCHDLHYPSQQASHKQAGRYAVQRRMDAIRRKLKMTGEMLPREKPAGVRWRTWLRLSEEYRELQHVEAEYTLRLIYSGTGPALWAQIGLKRDEVWPYLQPAADMAGYRERKRLRIYEPSDRLVELMRNRRRRRMEAPPLTINQLAKQAGVSLAFAREAEAAGLLRADRDRGRRWPKYRPSLARWLVKLAQMRADGLTWAEISDWSKRRWRTGEIAFPGKH